MLQIAVLSLLLAIHTFLKTARQCGFGGGFFVCLFVLGLLCVGFCLVLFSFPLTIGWITDTKGFVFVPATLRNMSNLLWYFVVQKRADFTKTFVCFNLPNLVFKRRIKSVWYTFICLYDLFYCCTRFASVIDTWFRIWKLSEELISGPLMGFWKESKYFNRGNN